MGKGSMPFIAFPICIFTVKYFKLSNKKASLILHTKLLHVQKHLQSHGPFNAITHFGMTWDCQPITPGALTAQPGQAMGTGSRGTGETQLSPAQAQGSAATPGAWNGLDPASPMPNTLAYSVQVGIQVGMPNTLAYKYSDWVTMWHN